MPNRAFRGSESTRLLRSDIHQNGMDGQWIQPVQDPQVVDRLDDIGRRRYGRRGRDGLPAPVWLVSSCNGSGPEIPQERGGERKNP